MRPAAPDGGFCQGCSDWIWLAVLRELLEHPPASIGILTAPAEADVAVLVSENESLRRRLAKR